MKNKQILTQIHFTSLSKMPAKEITDLRKRTKQFLQSCNWTPGDPNPKIIPWDLLVVDDYQMLRVRQAEEKGEIDSIIANWNPNRDTAGLVNYRTDGIYAGLLFLVDGYHRARAKERLQAKYGFEGAFDYIRNLSKDEEIILFANQGIGVTKLPIIAQYEAWLASSNNEDINVAASKMVNSVLKKYHVDSTIHNKNGDGYCKLGLAQAIKICNRAIRESNDDVFDFIISILKKSGFARTDRGLASDMLLVLEGIYKMTQKGIFGEDATPEAVAVVLTKELKKKTWTMLEMMGTFITDESAEQAKATDRRTRVRNLLAYYICKEFGLTLYGYHQPPEAYVAQYNTDPLTLTA